MVNRHVHGEIKIREKFCGVLAPAHAFCYIPLYKCRVRSRTTHRNVRACMHIMRHAKPAVCASQLQRRCLNCKGAVLKESSAVCASQLQRRCAQRIICCVCFSTAKALCSKNHLLCVLLNCKGAVLKESSAVCASQLQRRCAQRIILLFQCAWAVLPFLWILFPTTLLHSCFLLSSLSK